MATRVPAPAHIQPSSVVREGAEPVPLSAAGCPSRLLLDQIADKWSVLILAALCQGPLRFNALRRNLEGVTQKALTDALRRLERNGIVARRVGSAGPVTVEYSVTPLGRSLKEPFGILHAWTLKHAPEVEEARRHYDARVACEADPES